MTNVFPMQILVMAVGSPLGQSILKALQKSELPLTIHVADINSNAAGFYISDATSVIFPLLKAPDYLDKLFEYIKQHNINVIFPTIAAEHEFFAIHAHEFSKRNVHIVSCSPETFQICNDKLSSMQFLKNAGLNVPDTMLCSAEENLSFFLARNSFPVVLKPRYGASSNHVFIVENKSRLDGILSAFPNGYFVMQEFLSDPEDYTVGVFATCDRHYQDTFIIRRKLNFGLSYSGEIIQSDVISKYCLDIASALQSKYSINVQLKIAGKIPYAYEINPRLSSTTSVRAHFGFNEPDMILRDLFGILPINPRTPAQRGHFMRYWEEVYLENM